MLCLKELAFKCNSDKNIIFTGNIDNANDYYNMMDLFCLTSLNEGLPFVLIEAQSNGLKCLVSDSVDKNSNITGNITFLPLDKKIWIESLNKIDYIRSNKINMIEKSNYSITSTVKKIEDIYLG